MRLFILAQKDVLQILRDRRTTLFLILMPIGFTFFFGFMMGGLGEEVDPKLPVGWINQAPQNPISLSLGTLMESSDVIRPVELDPSEIENAQNLVQEGEFSAVLIFPAELDGLSLLNDTQKIHMITNPADQGGQTALNEIRVILTRILGSLQTANLSADTYEAQSDFANENERASYQAEAFDLAIEGWENPPTIITVEQSGTIEVEETQVFNSYAQASPGMIVQFAIFGLISTATVLVLERNTKTMQRMMTTPISRAETIAGHMLAMFTVVFIQELLLITFGQIVFKLEYSSDPLSVLLVAAALAIFSASLGMFIGTIAKTQEHVIMYAMLAMFLLSALGGAWFPLEVTGETFARIGHFTPTAWAMDGFQNVIVRGLGLESVMLPVAILMAYSTIFFALAVWRYRYV